MTDPEHLTPTIPADATEEEAAAIVAALVAVSAGAAATTPDEPPRWRFSGRWWTKPIPAGRDRP